LKKNLVEQKNACCRRKLKCFFDVALKDTKMQNYLEFLKFSGLNYSQYQFDGVKWLVEKETSEVSGRGGYGCGCGGGGILADEMGLGKTITMIGTFVSNLLPKTLIVVPLILIEQWKQQILKTTGHRVIVYHGPNKPDVSCLLSGLGSTSRKTYIVITTYHTLVSSTILHQIQWNRTIFDEAHHMRNKNTQCFRVACGLKRDICWLLTGTPIQNSEKDLENLCEVARIPFDRVQDYMLKRTKKEVGISMPELTENVEMISWRPDTSEHALGMRFHRLLEAKGIGCKLPIFLRAKQVCIMPEMVNTVEMISEVDALTTLAVAEDAVAQEKVVIVESSNSKIERAIEIMVERKLNGNQKIVFCHFHAEIDIIMIRLIDAGMTVGVLDGRRKCSVSDVEENDVLIIQIQTGCEGLNLQRFNEIYFIGPHWNPAVEDQAVARCHRIGQLKPVVVYRFIMENLVENTKSMDMYIRDVQERKRDIVRDMFDI
jgi:SNF2 family DNA or RNA helicase